MVNVVDISYRNYVLRKNQNENGMLEIACREEDWSEHWDHKMHEEDQQH